MASLVGLKDLHYALLEDDSDTGAKYKTPVRIIGAINAKISPKSDSETLFADDGPAETAMALGQIDIELEVKELPLTMLAALLGHSLVGGVMVIKDTDIAPYVALGFKSRKSNGKYRYTWLYKGKFALPEQEYATQEQKPKFQTGKIKGTFLKRSLTVHGKPWQTRTRAVLQAATLGLPRYLSLCRMSRKHRRKMGIKNNVKYFAPGYSP